MAISLILSLSKDVAISTTLNTRRRTALLQRRDCHATLAMTKWERVTANIVVRSMSDPSRREPVADRPRAGDTMAQAHILKTSRTGWS